MFNTKVTREPEEWANLSRLLQCIIVMLISRQTRVWRHKKKALACLSALLAGPEVSHGELEVRSVVGLPHAAVTAAGGLVLALMVDAAHSQVHVLRGEVVSGDVQVAGLVVLGDGLGGLQSDVAVEVGQGGGQGASGPVVGRLREDKKLTFRVLRDRS